MTISSEKIVEAVARASAERNGWDFDNMPGRARAIRYGSFSIEAELPCINGLRAWFTIATVHAPDDAAYAQSEKQITGRETL